MIKVAETVKEILGLGVLCVESLVERFKKQTTSGKAMIIASTISAILLLWVFVSFLHVNAINLTSEAGNLPSWNFFDIMTKLF